MRGKLQARGVDGVARRIIPARAGQTSPYAVWRNRSADHPRACGANAAATSSGIGWPGSSPRVRGKHRAHVGAAHTRRIIPARAGQTRCRRTGMRARPDHPRACGANVNTWSPIDLNIGSSPRVRGKPIRHHVARDRRRIIPARAGQTGRRARRVEQGPDHPRACGANTAHEVKTCRKHGSSPRVRGKLILLALPPRPIRIIPARAGQTISLSGTLRRRADHPRACGANQRRAFFRRFQHGSSPRVRGKLRDCAWFSAEPRIIPARAGQTCRGVACICIEPDHPRACGANVSAMDLLRFALGSSPRVRGKRSWRRSTPIAPRIIPARAGQTSGHPAWSVPGTDHPRACGANASGPNGPVGAFGSSPRVRGKLVVFVAFCFTCRIIPARAGQTLGRSLENNSKPDHPRACGANSNPAAPKKRNGGSSPRVRGKRLAGIATVHFGRIIPARAGQTVFRRQTYRPVPDHPRACGANAAVRRSFMIPSGSSPRVRGKPRAYAADIREMRIIPARAGQTATTDDKTLQRADHPRACGANSPILCENS